MRYVSCLAPGPPEMLVIGTAPIPTPGQDEVLIQVTGAGVNRPDVLQRKGKYEPPPGASPILGLEVAGIVRTLGSGVTEWQIGDAVCALVAGGGYAEYCVAPAAQCLPVPARLTLVEAAALPETYFTVWTNVFERGALRAGETLLVHGGASGIGTTAIQLAHVRGARVIVTAGTDARCEACRALGADVAINYHTVDFVTAVDQATGGHGVDVVLDMVGGSYLARNLTVLGRDGRLVQIAVLEGARAELDLSVIMRKRLIVTGSHLRPRSVAEKGAIARALRAEVWPLLAAGRVRPVVYRTVPLADAAEAHRLMESGAQIGKIVLTT